MDAIQSSRQRNRSSSSLGKLTRSRSQIFFHRSRSGLLRPDSGRRHKPYELPTSRRRRRHRSSESEDNNTDEAVLEKRICKKTKLTREAAAPSSAGEEDEMSRVLMKDLRARRVYSPRSSAGACSALVTDMFSKGSGVGSDIGDQRLSGLGLDLNPSVENGGCEKVGSKIETESDNLEKVPESQKKNDEANSVSCLLLNEYKSDKDSDLYADDKIESADLGLSPEAPKSEPGNAEFLNESIRLQDGQQIIGISLEKIDGPTEELVQTTPSDAVICVDSEAIGDDDKRVEEVHVNVTLVAENAVENASKGSCPKDGQKNDSIPKSKSMLRPRLPGKLFKAPGSVSFRRLFPFLKDMLRVQSAMPKTGCCQKDEKGVDGQELKLPLSSQSHEASKHELRTETPSMGNTCQSVVSEGDAVVTPVNESSHCNESKRGSSHHLLESPLHLRTKEVISEHLSVSSAKDECLSESKPDIVGFHCVQEVGNDLHKDNLKQDSKHNINPGYTKATNHGGCTSEQFDVLNEDCILTTPPETETSDKPEVNLQSDSADLYNVKVMDTSRSNQENVFFYLKTDNIKDSIVKRNSVPRSNLHRKLFKNPGSVNYNRLLPFLMDFNRDEYGHQTNHNKDEVDTYSKGFQLPITSQSQEDPIVKMSPSNQPRLPSSQDLHEVVHECLSSTDVNEHVESGFGDKCPSDAKFDPDSVMVDFQSVDDVPNALHKDGIEHVLKKISGDHNCESPPKVQNVLQINANVSNLTFEHNASKEKRLSIECVERKQEATLERCESVGKYPHESQNLDNLDPNMPDAEDNEKGSCATCRSDEAVVLNHVSVSNEESGASSEKIILEKSDMAGHRVHEAGSVLKGIVYDPKVPSKGNKNRTVNRVVAIGSSSGSHTTLVINRCSRMKLLKHAGSLNYKRMLPYLLNALEDNSGNSANDQCPKVQKRMDQTPLLPISDSDGRVTPVCDSTGCVPKEHCTSSSGTQQPKGLHACDSNGDSSIPLPKVPESRPSHGSWNDIQLQGEELVVSNGPFKRERSEEATSASPEALLSSEVRGNSSSLISSNGENPPETHGLSRETVLEKPRVSAIGFKKGILKRNPRGCRGICTCLNCASFRLHAERAFEFSRNQFLDAEEVARDLMKELSHIRNILERSTESVNDNPVSEAKEACSKALIAEQLARDRFSQMNNNLNIHCRISNMQRPRVRFSDHVEEKVFDAGR